MRQTNQQQMTMAFRKTTAFFLSLVSTVLVILTDSACLRPREDYPPEMRGVWVQCDAARSAKELGDMLDTLSDGGFNTVFFCAGSGMANYHSQLLTPLAHVTPDFDPLAQVVKQAHARGLQVHAWWSPGVMMRYGTLGKEHPEWDIASKDGMPGDFHWPDFSLRSVREFVGDVVLEIAENYNVDGVHLDYIRYPAPPPYSEVDVRPFFGPSDVSTTVRTVYRRLKSSRPKTQLTAAVIAGQDAASNHLQNWAFWLTGEYIDYVIPMAYFDAGDEARLRRYAREWQRLANSERIVPGLSAYNTSSGSKVVKTAEELLQQIALCEDHGTRGYVIFDEDNISNEILRALAARADSTPVFTRAHYSR